MLTNRTALRAYTGFTLIELLVVIIILAILAAVVVPKVIGHTDDAKIAAAISTMKAMDTALDTYKLDTGAYPTNDQGLQSLIANPGTDKWNGPYLKNQATTPMDPWGHPYLYKCPGDNGRDYDLMSAGPDGQPGTADDIQAWNIGS